MPNRSIIMMSHQWNNRVGAGFLSVFAVLEFTIMIKDKHKINKSFLFYNHNIRPYD